MPQWSIEYLRLPSSVIVYGCVVARILVVSPFYTTKKEGPGIGLSLARQIMRQHNGSIDLIRSDADETVFQLIFR